MSTVTTAEETEFWFAFDNAFFSRFGMVSDEMSDAVGAVHALELSWRTHQGAGTYPEGFVADAQEVAADLVTVFTAQLAIIEQHFHGDPDAERSAFEDFAQGVLFDPRRPPPYAVHMMDHSPGGTPIGFHAWHAAIRGAMLAGAVDAERWLGIDRLVGLAWAVQTVADPTLDAEDNPRLPDDRLRQLRDIWLRLTPEALDDAFSHRPFPPPALLGVVEP